MVKRYGLLIVLLLAVIAGSSIGVLGQDLGDVDEILRRHAESFGPEAGKVESAILRYRASIEGIDISMVVTVVPGTFCKTEMQAMGFKQVDAWYNGEGWVQNTALNRRGRSASPEELKEMRSSASLFGPLYDYHKGVGVSDRVKSVELTGSDKVGVEDCYRLLVTYADGDTETFLISKSSYRLLRSQSMDGGYQEFSGYEAKDGVYFARDVKLVGAGLTQSIRLQTVKLNPKLNLEKLFKRP